MNKNTRRRIIAALTLTTALLATGAAAVDIIATPQGDTAWGAPTTEDHDPTSTVVDNIPVTITPLDTAWG